MLLGKNTCAETRKSSNKFLKKLKRTTQSLSENSLEVEVRGEGWRLRQRPRRRESPREIRGRERSRERGHEVCREVRSIETI